MSVSVLFRANLVKGNKCMWREFIKKYDIVDGQYTAARMSIAVTFKYIHLKVSHLIYPPHYYTMK